MYNQDIQHSQNIIVHPKITLNMLRSARQHRLAPWTRNAECLLTITVDQEKNMSFVEVHQPQNMSQDVTPLSMKKVNNNGLN